MDDMGTFRIDIELENPTGSGMRRRVIRLEDFGRSTNETG